MDIRFYIYIYNWNVLFTVESQPLKYQVYYIY